jgi:L-ribulose-5-phosphate 4-epimerase
VDRDELRARTVEANVRLERAGLIVLSWGNASIVDREAGLFAIKPSGVPYADLTPPDIVLVSLEDGRVVDGALRPSSDTPTHLVLYQRYPSLGAVVHTHSPHATAWAQARREIPCFGTTHADVFHGPVPVTRPLTAEEIEGAYERETGRVIVERLDGAGLDPLHVPGVLVAGHGPFTWGPTGEEAVTTAIALEAVAAMALRTLVIAPDAMAVEDALLEKHFTRKHGPRAYYGQPGPVGRATSPEGRRP